MLKRFINEEETFAVNENLNIDIRYVGPTNAKVIIVDNFYKNPELVRDLALTIPPSTDEILASNLPVGPDSGRIDSSYKLQHIGKYIERIFKEAVPETYQHLPPNYFLNIFFGAKFLCNVMTSNNLPPRVPHCDSAMSLADYAALIYLNTPEECAGGTGLYTFGGSRYHTNLGSRRTIDIEGLIPADHYVVDSVGDWELVDLIEMKFNRLVLYPQSHYHTAYIKPGMFVNGTYRINQLFFI